jgi:signal transduction histidine kinase
VIKASQAVSGELVLKKLIETLLVIAVEHAGAERGLLILPHGEEHRIEAEARTGRHKVEVQLQQALVTPTELPESLFRYVVRTQESVILDDASVQNLFSEDEYVRLQRPRSILCLPLVKQAKLKGVLYLENNLAPRVFTPKRLAMLELLASQAGISLDHAQHADHLAKANEALRGCLDTLASAPELDDFLGQVMAVVTSHLGAIASTLQVLNVEQNTLTLELLFQDGRVMSAPEAKYPASLRSLSLDEQRLSNFLDQPTTLIHVEDPRSPVTEALRVYLLDLGIKTLLIIPLTLGGQANGQLSFRFIEERDFGPEELEVARALAIQASLAIQLTRSAKTARQSAVLAERNELAGEIHDSLAQFFTGISMQLGAAMEVIEAGGGSVLGYVERAFDLAQFGVGEARRSAFSLQPKIIEESGLIEALQKMIERSNIPGRLRCNFHSTGVPEENLPPWVQQDLLRIAQEAMSNAVRHARPTVINVSLRCNPPNLVLEVTDNGSGIADSQPARKEGLGFPNMRARAENIGAQLEVRTAKDRGTTIVVHIPMNF